MWYCLLSLCWSGMLALLFTTTLLRALPVPFHIARCRPETGRVPDAGTAKKKEDLTDVMEK